MMLHAKESMLFSRSISDLFTQQKSKLMRFIRIPAGIFWNEEKRLFIQIKMKEMSRLQKINKRRIVP